MNRNLERSKAPANISNDNPELSYAAYFDDPFQRAVVRIVERLSGQRKFKSLYDIYRAELSNKLSFWQASIQLLNLDVRFSDSQLAKIPSSGPLIVVANHPYGVLDGVMLGWLISQVRSDFKILVNSVLLEAPEVRDQLLPIDFGESREALVRNIETRKRAIELLRNGECIIVFPAGGISTARSVFGAAIDDTWKPFTGKLIAQSEAAILPIYFEGENSRLFQWVSRVSLAMRLALIFREVLIQAKSPLQVTIGDTFPSQKISQFSSRTEMMHFLRSSVYSLAPDYQRERLAKVQSDIFKSISFSNSNL